MTKRFFGFRIFGFLGLVASLVAMDAALPASQASAQEVQITGPLAGAPAVRRMRLYREGRILIEPNFSFTLQDEFARSLIAGAHIGYYFTDWLGVGVSTRASRTKSVRAASPRTATVSASPPGAATTGSGARSAQAETRASRTRSVG